MTPTHKELENLLQTLCADADPSWTAYSENYLFEERVSRQRQADYESALTGHTADGDAWDRWHRDQYLPTAIQREVPETFTVRNGNAAHAADLGEDQWLVRVEKLTHALGDTGLTIDQLQEVLEVAAGSVRGRQVQPGGCGGAIVECLRLAQPQPQRGAATLRGLSARR